MQLFNEKVVKKAIHLQSKSKIDAIENLARSEPGIPIEASSFDQNQYLLNTPNCVVDLTTGNLFSHDPSWYMTKLTSVGYDPSAQCPRWDEFLNTVMDGNQEMIKFLQRCIGYALTGSTKEQCFFILFGKGNNGKSTFLKVVKEIMGDYAVSAQAETFMQKKGR